MESKLKYDTRGGPSDAAWRLHKKTIIDLYQNGKLSDVMLEMEAQYNFVASKRMYDTRFRKWKVTKILPREDKRRIAEGIARECQSGGPTVATPVSKKDLMKTMRWISSQSGIKKSPSASQVPARLNSHRGSREESVSSSSPGAVDGASNASTNDFPEDARSSIGDSPAILPDVVLSIHDASLSSFDESIDLEGLHFTPSPSPPMALSEENRAADLIFRSVNDLVVSRLRHLTSRTNTEDVLSHGSSQASDTFWHNIKNGIYFLKIASKFPDSTFRVATALEEAKFLLPTIMEDELPLDFLRGVLAILSPTNTDIQPAIRFDMLSSIMKAASASKKLGPQHPIAVICHALQHDTKHRFISSLALHVIADVISEQLGFSDQAYRKLMNTIIKLTRRSGDLDTAKDLAQGELEITRSKFGEDSYEARHAAVELSRILKKLGDHGRTLSLLTGVVSVPQSKYSESDLREEEHVMLRHDDISIGAMEDIAEYYFRFESTYQGIVWLQRAKTTAEDVWGNTAATGHIADKLQSVLRGNLHGQVIDE